MLDKIRNINLSNKKITTPSIEDYVKDHIGEFVTKKSGGFTRLRKRKQLKKRKTKTRRRNKKILGGLPGNVNDCRLIDDQGEPNVCPICLDSLNNGQDIINLHPGASHCIHLQCSKAWYEQKSINSPNEGFKCIVCNIPIDIDVIPERMWTFGDLLHRAEMLNQAIIDAGANDENNIMFAERRELTNLLNILNDNVQEHRNRDINSIIRKVIIFIIFMLIVILNITRNANI